MRAYPPAGPADREVDLAEPPGQRGRRAEQQGVLGVRGDRVAGQREVRRAGAARSGPGHRVGHGGADLHQDPGAAVRVEPFGQLGGGDPGHAGPVDAGGVAGGGGEQLQSFGRAGRRRRAGGRGRRRPRRRRAGPSGKRSMPPPVRGGEPGERLVHLGQGRGRARARRRGGRRRAPGRPRPAPAGPGPVPPLGGQRGSSVPSGTSASRSQVAVAGARASVGDVGTRV